MRITGVHEDEPLSEVWAYLTRAEARLLYSALEYYFTDDEIDPGWHHHVGDAGGPELTIAIETPAIRNA